ncbi:13448_t:CDS:2, partial [Ambispora gerdemannii]
MNGIVNNFSQYAFFLMIHVSDNDFNGNEISQELENQILTISTDRYAEEKRKILVLYKDTQKKTGQRARDTLNKRNASPSPILSLFAEEINENDICEMRAFACDVDNFFKEHLRDLSELDQSEEFTQQRIRQQIEDNDISIHDFLAGISYSCKGHGYEDITVSQKLYSVDIKTRRTPTELGQQKERLCKCPSFKNDGSKPSTTCHFYYRLRELRQVYLVELPLQMR